MRKTLFALLGLVAIGIGAVPALAGVAAVNDPPKAYRVFRIVTSSLAFLDTES